MYRHIAYAHAESLCTGHVPPNLPIRTDLLKNSRAGSVAYLLKSVSVGVLLRRVWTDDAAL
jgi:hypothetical protein